MTFLRRLAYRMRLSFVRRSFFFATASLIILAIIAVSLQFARELLSRPFESEFVRTARLTLTYANDDDRIAAATRLGYLGENARSAVPELLQLTNDTSSHVRSAANQALGFICQDGKCLSQVNDAIALSAAHEPWVGDRAIACESLRRLNDPRAFDLAIRLLNETDEMHRSYALDVVGKFHTPLAVYPLLKSGDACWAIGTIGELAASEFAYSLLNEDKELKQAALACMRLMSSRGFARDILRSVPMKEVVERSFKWNDPICVQAALYVADARDDGLSFDLLWQILQDEDLYKHPGIRRQTVEVLVKKHPNQTRPHLLKLMDDPELRHAAALGLAQIGDEASAQAMLQRWRSEPNPESNVLLRALARMKRPEVYDTLIRIVSDPGSGIVTPSVESLKWLGDPRALPALEALLREPEVRADRIEIRAAIAELKGESQYSVYYPIVEEMGWTDGEAYFEKLASGGSDARPFLLKLMNSESVYQNSSIKLLGEQDFEAPDFQAALVLALADGYCPAGFQLILDRNDQRYIAHMIRAMRGTHSIPIADRLQEWSGKNYVLDREAWQKWWIRNQHKFPKQAPLPDNPRERR